jgi:hypothetical protein
MFVRMPEHRSVKHRPVQSQVQTTEDRKAQKWLWSVVWSLLLKLEQHSHLCGPVVRVPG